MPKGPKRTFKLTRVGEPLQPNDWPKPLQDVLGNLFAAMIKDREEFNRRAQSEQSPHAVG